MKVIFMLITVNNYIIPEKKLLIERETTIKLSNMKTSLFIIQAGVTKTPEIQTFALYQHEMLHTTFHSC